MPVVGFTQDPEAPEGAGMFHLDDGRDMYAHDPDLARSLSQPMQLNPADYGVMPQDDQRLALNDRNSPNAIDVGAPMTGNQFQDALGNLNFRPNQPAPAPAEPRGTPAPPPKDVIEPPAAPGSAGETEQDRNARAVVARQLRAQGAARPEAWIPKSKAETVETEGAPYNPEDAAVRIAANRQVIQAKAATAEMIRDRAVNDAASARAAQPELLQRAAEAQKQLDAQHTAYLRERSDLEKAIEQSNASQGGASSWFANKGTLAQVAMTLGQAFGAYAATLSGGQNWAQQQLNTIMEQDIAAQREGAKRGVDNALRRLELRYKDKDQAEAALRLAQGNILANVQSMHAAANQSQDVQAAFQEMAAENQQNVVAQEQKFQNAAYGKHKVTVDVAHQSASAGGQQDPLRVIKRLHDEAGYSWEEAREYVLGKGGGRQSTDAIDRKNVATVGGQAFEFDSPEEARAAKEKAPHIDRMITQAERLKELQRKGAWTPTERSEVSSLQRELTLEVPSAFSGSTRLNEPELQGAAHLVGDPDAWLKTDVTGRSAAALDTIIRNAKAERDGIMQGGVRVSRQLGKNKEGQRERQYTYQTGARTLEEVE